MPKADWGGALGGAASGAASGASIGSVIPGIGTGIGGAIGGLVGGIGSLFGNKKKKPKRKSTLDPQQQALYNDYISSIRGEGPMKDMYNFDAQGYNDVFDKTIGRAANRNFQENTIPSITGQFRNNNLMNSSYAGESLARAGRDVQENLDAQRSANVFQGQQQANANKQNALNSILGMNTFDYQQRQQGGGIDEILNKVAPHAGEWFANYLKSKGTSTPSTPAI